MTRAIMNGCNGKMGQCITGICAQDEDIEIVAGIDTYDGIKNDYPVFSSPVSYTHLTLPTNSLV